MGKRKSCKTNVNLELRNKSKEFIKHIWMLVRLELFLHFKISYPNILIANMCLVQRAV